MSLDGWTFVAKKGCKKRVSSVILQGPNRHVAIYNTAILSDAQNVLRNSALWRCLRRQLQLLNRCRPFGSLEGLGLGQPTMSQPALFQLALFGMIRDLLEVPSDRATVFDPVMSQNDKHLCASLGLHSGEAMPSASEGSKLLFMPHCDKSLYGKKLLENVKDLGAFEGLEHIVIFGNNLRWYSLPLVQTFSHAGARSETDMVDSVGPRFDVSPMPDFDDCPNAFNDQALMFHQFKDSCSDD